MISNSLLPIILTVAVILLLLLVLSLTKTILPLNYIKLKDKKRYQKILYYIEIFGGIIVLSMFAGYLYHRSTVVAMVLMLFLALIILFFGWFFIKDYVAGLVIKASANLSLNDIIEINGIKGKIISFGHLSIVVNSEEGKKIYLPYSKIASNIKAVKVASEIKNNQSFEIICKNVNNKEKFSENVKKYILTLPWVNHTIMPDVEITEIDNKDIKLNITLVLYDRKYYIRTLETIKNKFA
jgi:hypothetical protein